MGKVLMFFLKYFQRFFRVSVFVCLHDVYCSLQIHGSEGCNE